MIGSLHRQILAKMNQSHNPAQVLREYESAQEQADRGVPEHVPGMTRFSVICQECDAETVLFARIIYRDRHDHPMVQDEIEIRQIDGTMDMDVDQGLHCDCGHYFEQAELIKEAEYELDH